MASDFDFRTTADKEREVQKNRLVDLIEFLRTREDGTVRPITEIDRIFGRTNTQAWFRRKTLAMPNMESLERIAKVAGRHHSGRPWTLLEIRHYLKTGEHPEPVDESIALEDLMKEISAQDEETSLKIIDAAAANLKSPEAIGQAIGICSSYLAQIGRTP